MNFNLTSISLSPKGVDAFTSGVIFDQCFNLFSNKEEFRVVSNVFTELNISSFATTKALSFHIFGKAVSQRRVQSI